MSKKPVEDFQPERRIFRRRTTSAEIIITTENGDFTGMMVNLSMGGLFVAISKRMKVAIGDPLRISIPLAGEFLNDFIQIDGTVVRVEKSGLAVRFLQMDRITFHTLLSLINRPGQ